MTVADRIKNKRLELNMTQKELSDKIGTKDRSSVSKIETKGDDISMKDILRIADALNVTPQYLLGWENDISVIEAPQVESETAKARLKRAIDYLNRFEEAPAEVQSMIEYLLKSSQSDT